MVTIRRFILALVVVLLAGTPISMAQPTCPSAADSARPIGSIAFVSDRDGDQQIYSMNSDGTNPVRLTHLRDAILSDLDWSPDGQSLAFVNQLPVSDSQNQYDIFVLDVATGRITRLTDDEPSENRPSWSPDGKFIAYLSDVGGAYDIWVMTGDGKIVQQITHDPRWELSVDWRPGVSQIAYVPNSGADLQIWLEGWQTPLKENPLLFDHREANETDYLTLHSVIDLDWSPDGRWIALETDFGAHVVNVANAEIAQIEDRRDFAYGDAPSWSPDSCHVVFASRRDGNLEIYVYDLASATAQRLTINDWNDYDPVWRPDQAQ